MIGVESLAIAVVLLKNLAVLICGVAAYCWVRRGPREQDNKVKLVIEAAVLSLMTVYTMVSGTEPAGVLTDARFILVPLATIFSGPIVGTVVTACVVIVRVYIGGVGAFAGVMAAFPLFLLALLLARYFAREARLPTLIELLWISLASTAVSFISWVFLPWNAEILRAAAEAALALVVVNPIGMMAFGSLILWDERLKQLQIAKANEYARFRAVVDNLPLSLAIRTLDDRVTLLNRRYEELCGPEIMQFIGKDVRELRAHILPSEQQVISDRDKELLLETGQPVSRYITNVPFRGSLRSIQLTNFGIHDAAGKLQSIGTIGVDVTELVKRKTQAEALQAQLVQAGKMEAIGQLAGGVAHDFNNLLGAIIGFAGFLTEDLSDRPQLQSHALRILKICDRAKSLVRQILSFASADRLGRELVDLRTVIAETRDLLRPTLPPTTELYYDLGERPVPLVANEGQISRLIVNLCVNASDALAGRRGRLSVKLGIVDLSQNHLDEWFSPDQSRVISGKPAPGGQFVRIEVRDNGSGMDPETLKRIMEPFFTTKGRKEGTGLGLWIVDGIVHAYRGYSVVDSELGVGTRFAIYLPYEREAEAEDTLKALPSVPKATLKGNERILVVDDQEDILDVFLIGLERIGFEVACSNDPNEALELFEEEPDLWDVVITDQVMPGMRGTELLKKMRHIRPDLRTVLCTGFGELATDEPLSLESVDISLMKPIQPNVLAEHIRVLVDMPGTKPTRH